MLVRLRNTGFIDSESTTMSAEEVPPKTLTKRARLVYVGDFESMDGPVKVTEEHLNRVCEKYNGKLAKLKRLALAETVPVGSLPPVQLDHTRSARDTVGRLENTDLVIEDWTDEEGTTRKALYGNVRFLGRENVEKVMDGRWSTLSIGADFEDGRLDELSVTPFPAAESASVLGKHRLGWNGNAGLSFSYKGKNWEIWQRDDTDTFAVESDSGRTEFNFSYNRAQGLGALKNELQAAAKKAIDRKNLSRLQKPVSEFQHKGLSVSIYQDGTNKYYMTADNYNGGGGFDAEITANSVSEAEKKAKSIVEKSMRLSNINKESLMQLAMYQRLRKFFKLKKKMSDEEVDEKMNKLAEEEDEKELKKLADEMDEEEKKELSDEEKENEKLEGEDDEEKKKLGEFDVSYKGLMIRTAKEGSARDATWSYRVEKDGEVIKQKGGFKSNQEAISEGKKFADNTKMSAARESLTRLGADFRSKRDSAQLAAKAAAISSRLSAIRATGRITPAEVKKIDLKALAGKSQEAIDAVMKSYEDRQPVILVGQLGSMKAMSLKEIEKETKAVRMSRLETETRANMSLLRHTVEEKKLAEGEAAPDTVNIHVDTDPHTDLSSMEADYNEMCAMMDGGKIQEAKDRMKGWMERMKKMGAYGMAEPTMHENSMEQLSALAADLDQLSAKFDEAMGLAESLAIGAQ